MAGEVGPGSKAVHVCIVCISAMCCCVFGGGALRQNVAFQGIFWPFKQLNLLFGKLLTAWSCDYVPPKCTTNSEGEEVCVDSSQSKREGCGLGGSLTSHDL